jgi:hypothetical protein
VELALEELINSATEEERQTLKEILDSWSTSPAAISKAFQKRSLNIFQRVAGSTRTYNEILFGVASEHGVYRRFFETAEDLERRLIRINDQWRLCFTWRDGNAHYVEIVDHH